MYSEFHRLLCWYLVTALQNAREQAQKQAEQEQVQKQAEQEQAQKQAEQEPAHQQAAKKEEKAKLKKETKKKATSDEEKEREKKIQIELASRILEYLTQQNQQIQQLPLYKQLKSHLETITPKPAQQEEEKQTESDLAWNILEFLGKEELKYLQHLKLYKKIQKNLQQKLQPQDLKLEQLPDLKPERLPDLPLELLSFDQWALCLAVIATARGRQDTDSPNFCTTGAVMAVGNTIISVGYSGLKKGNTNLDETQHVIDPAVHAELNAFLLRSVILQNTPLKVMWSPYYC